MKPAIRTVPIHNGHGKTTKVEEGATRGAVLGESLFYPDGTLVTLEALQPVPTTPTPSAGGIIRTPSITVWQLIQSIPSNIMQLAALTGEGFAHRAVDGAWTLREARFRWTQATADTAILDNTGYVFRGTGSELFEATLPDPLPAGFNTHIVAKGCAVRILAGGNAIGGMPVGENLMLDDGQAVQLAGEEEGIATIVGIPLNEAEDVNAVFNFDGLSILDDFEGEFIFDGGSITQDYDMTFDGGSIA